MTRSGARWKDLPERFGPFERAKKRYYRWLEQGVLNRVFEAVAAETDLEWVMLDATIIRARAQAAGARRKRAARTPRRLAVHAAASGPSCMSVGRPGPAGPRRPRPRPAERHDPSL
jgi:transposase